jgi:hypothetical protein
MAIDKLDRHKSPDTDQILVELIKAGRRTIRSEIHKLINSIWNMRELCTRTHHPTHAPLAEYAAITPTTSMSTDTIEPFL